ncbi:glutaredoxin domain-containing protein [Geobacter sp.]|uniref:glutaredoxin domain-containing protein n=1 Tax=Geobacter sp. TaxID=46610 RepID=UPI00260BAB71|nr:glutaredoxin domain-containing protein [Geobacter sp.]
MRKITTAALFLTAAFTAAAGMAAELPAPPQSKIDAKAPKQQSYPKIVLYSVAWCPHCKEAKEYFTTHNIPFINKDVELDATAMEELTQKYRSQGVPVIVIGDRKVLKGFTPEIFEKAVKELQKK